MCPQNYYRQLIGAGDSLVMASHSAGTDELQKTLSKLSPEVKANAKFIFGSPRMDPKTFNNIITAQGLRKDQVLIIQSSGDMPHTPYLGYANLYQEALENIGSGGVISPVMAVGDALFQQSTQKGFCNYNGNWNSIYVDQDLTDPDHPMLGHEVTIEGVLQGHQYSGEFNGQDFEEETLAAIVKRFLDRR